MRVVLGAVLVGYICSTAVQAGVSAPFTEDFSSNSANWRDVTGLASVDWNAAGGPDGGAFASTTLNFAALNANDGPPLFRAQDEFNSSGGAFVGDWVGNDITGFSAFVRHDAPVPINFFARFASPANSPGAIKVFFIPVAPNTWTSLNLTLPDPSMIFAL